MRLVELGFDIATELLDLVAHADEGIHDVHLLFLQRLCCLPDAFLAAQATHPEYVIILVSLHPDSAFLAPALGRFLTDDFKLPLHL